MMFINNYITFILVVKFALPDNFSTLLNISSYEVPFDNYSITEVPLNVSFIINLDPIAYGDISQIAPLDFASDRIYGDVTVMKDLFKNILYEYDTRIRPIWDQSTAINVSTKFVPMSILDFDIASQTFSILGYFRVWWRDELLTWNEEHYSQTNTVKIPIKEIWTPSLIILKAIKGDGVVGNMETDIAKVSSSGDVQWVPEGLYSVVCDVNIQYYPFDKQVCTLTFYVSDETEATVVLNHNTDVTLEEFTDNTAWDVKQVETKQITKYNTSFINISFHVHRRSGFVTFTLIMPLLMLAFLNICIFLVPIGSGEKGTFSITIFLSYGIFITVVSNTLPPNSLQISYFVLFITVLLFLSVLTVFYTVLQAKLIAVFGEKRCPWAFIIPRKGVKHGCDSADEFEEIKDVEKCVENEVEKPYTWAMVLQRIDTIIFIVLLTIVTVVTFLFLFLVM
ncbi:acetylcholine receptor subunit beta-type unc-29-like [Ruditapes philippinarum]|uniref:acetylcholine receptor subunit beta-type unc-29-like n=1 Tax=Ruditapes philippinarum TaxID=129788 RepID=UPI00295B0510|nr:acetylcholine receptor subunit beta-type unc-29-like [Ruditapes philippinarum]